MIITVTLNPALDKTVELDSLNKGQVNRIKNVLTDAGGKGINVSKTLKALGVESVATGFLGGENGKIIADALDELDIENDFVWVENETRINTKIVEADGTVTEINEPGFAIDYKYVDALLQKLEAYAEPDVVFVLSGSVPQGVNKDIYSKIIQVVKARNARVILDCDGEAFKLAMEAEVLPDVIKPNHHELAFFEGKDKLDPKEITNIAYNFIQNGIKTVAVTMGASGAIIFSGEDCLWAKALEVEVNSTVGAGDAFVAGLAVSINKDYSLAETLKLCMAVSAGAVTTKGTKPPTKELVNYLKELIIL